jgi:14-3-3 protein
MAEICEQAERYEEMTEWISNAVSCVSPSILTPNEQRLVSVAFKNAVSLRRSSWRQVYDSEQQETRFHNSDRVAIAKDLRTEIEKELTGYCELLVSLLDKYLIPSVPDMPSKAFYLKLKADYLRYLCEISSGKEKVQLAKQAADIYEESAKIAKEVFPASDNIRLGIALNMSVFYYEVLNEFQTACVIARTAFEAAASELDIVDESKYKEISNLMQLIRENLTMWTTNKQKI